jgi:hypothetical protein
MLFSLRSLPLLNIPTSVHLRDLNRHNIYVFVLAGGKKSLSGYMLGCISTAASYEGIEPLNGILRLFF